MNREEKLSQINNDWDVFCKEAQDSIDQLYKAIESNGRIHTNPDFIEQNVDRIRDVERAIEVARRSRNDRKSDLEDLTGGQD